MSRMRSICGVGGRISRCRRPSGRRRRSRRPGARRRPPGRARAAARPRRDQRGAAGRKTSASRVEVGEQLLGQRALGRDVADEAVQPGRQRLPRRQVGEVVGRRGRSPRPRRRRRPRAGPGGVGKWRYSVPIPTPARRAISSSDAVGAVLGERLARGREQLVVVAPRVGALGALGRSRVVSVGMVDGLPLEKRREPPLSC